MVDYVAAILLSLATALVIRFMGLRSFERAIDALAQLVGGWRPAEWPKGVQEEDRDSPWGRSRRSTQPTEPMEPPPPTPQLLRVQPTIRGR